jgi:hypothetical protein
VLVNGRLEHFSQRMFLSNAATCGVIQPHDRESGGGAPVRSPPWFKSISRMFSYSGDQQHHVSHLLSLAVGQEPSMSEVSWADVNAEATSP